MNKNRFYIGLFVSAIVIVIAYVANGMLNEGREEPYHSVSVIVDNSSSDRWVAFRAGLEQGAEDHRLYLNVVSTGGLDSLEEECSMIEREMKNGADGVIAEMCDSDDSNHQLMMAASESPLILAGTGVSSAEMFTVVAPDDYLMGKSLAEAFLAEQHDGSLRVGILTGNQKQNAMQERLRGCREVLQEAGGHIVWEVSQEDMKQEAHLAEIYHLSSPADILITLDNDATELAVDCLLEHDDLNWRIYGVGRSEKAVYYLDKGIILGMIVPDDFYMGYESMRIMANRLNYHQDENDQADVGFLYVTRDNLYDEDNAMVLFPTIR